jgi:nucleoid-associated protein YgaU
MITPRQSQLEQDADAKAAEGSYLAAINLYEAALDGTPASAAIHYKLALLYDDKMNDPLNALHHFKRVLTLQPTGKRAEQVKTFMKRDELNLLTSLSGDAVITGPEAARLRNENLSLRKQLEDRWAERKSAHNAEKPPAPVLPAGPKTGSGSGRSYTVQRGDTLASIARKFYRNSSAWGKILAANPEILAKPADLKPGQSLRIP